MHQAMGSDKHMLMTSNAINDVVSTFKMIHETKNKTSHELDVSVGMGDMNRGQVYVVVAKYDYTSPHWHNYIGVGGAAVNSDLGGTLYQLHVHAGSMLKVIQYATPKLSLGVSTGLQMEGMMGFDNPYSNGADVSGNLEAVGKVNGVYKPNNKVRLVGDLELRGAVGPGSWGDTVGSYSGGNGAGALGTLSNLRLHVNQVYGQVTAEEKVSSKVTAYQQVTYQGSNIGQALSGIAGVSLSAPKGVEILVFSGYSTSKLPGYMTQNSLLVGSNGAVVGAGIQTKSGISFTGTVSNITSSAPPTFTGNLSIPLGAPPKKSVRSHHLE
jgi:hypothetical protein